jgi:hypothetical protein
MRRVRIPENNNNDPQAIFAVGIDQIVSDRISKSTIFDDQELRAMRRSPTKQAIPTSIFAVVARQLF